jgi:hypothetical protein
VCAPHDEEEEKIDREDFRGGSGVFEGFSRGFSRGFRRVSPDAGASQSDGIRSRDQRQSVSEDSSS